MVQYKAIGLLVMADQYDLSIGVIFNDLERPPDPHFKVTPIFDVMSLTVQIDEPTMNYYTRPTHNDLERPYRHSNSNTHTHIELFKVA